MPWLAAAFIVPGERIPDGEGTKNSCHGIMSHPVNPWTTYLSTVMGTKSDSGVWNLLRQMDGCNLHGVWVVHYMVVSGGSAFNPLLCCIIVGFSRRRIRSLSIYHSLTTSGDMALCSTKVLFDIWPGRRSLDDDVTVTFINQLPFMVGGHFLVLSTMNIFSRYRPLVISDKSKKFEVRIVLPSSHHGGRVRKSLPFRQNPFIFPYFHAARRP